IPVCECITWKLSIHSLDLQHLQLTRGTNLILPLPLGHLPRLPPPLRPLTKLPPRQLLQPALLPLHTPNLPVLIALLKEPNPMPQRLMNPPPRLRQLLLPHPRQLFLRELGVDLWVLERQEHLLYPSHVGRAVLGK